MSRRIWIAAAAILLLALCINLVTDSGSLCKEGSREDGSSLCTAYHFIGYYRLTRRVVGATESMAKKVLHRLLGQQQQRPHSGSAATPSESGKGAAFPHRLLWMAPFLSGGGYCSEALSFVLGLESSGSVPHLCIQPHGDMASEVFWRGLPASTKKLLMARAYHQADLPLNDTVVICHSEPGAWSPPLYETLPCPPSSGHGDGDHRPRYAIGRTMFETDRLSREHVDRCNRMDEVWVPSRFNAESFARSGVDPSRLVRIGQSVDSSFFDPSRIVAEQAFETVLSSFDRVLGEEEPRSAGSAYVFLSIFKWELRKGWDVLIQAYVEEFSAADDVLLCIKTSEYHSAKRSYGEQIRGHVKKLGLIEPADGWPAILVSDEHVPQSDLPRLYKAADAFVLPSRGEGWGRPHVEAMAMALPVIATNWSGMTEYMDEENSYPLRIDGLVEIDEGPFRGHFWADPSVPHLRHLMRRVYLHPSEAKAKGLLARKTMVDRFSPQRLTLDVVENLMRIARKIE